MDFEIEQIISIREQAYVLARQITPGNFELSDNAQLGGVDICKWSDIPRNLDLHGDQRLDIYAFLLRDNEDASKLSVGKIVGLTL